MPVSSVLLQVPGDPIASWLDSTDGVRGLTPSNALQNSMLVGLRLNTSVFERIAVCRHGEHASTIIPAPRIMCGCAGTPA